jgi:hypothetical protein
LRIVNIQILPAILKLFSMFMPNTRRGSSYWNKHGPPLCALLWTRPNRSNYLPNVRNSRDRILVLYILNSCLMVIVLGYYCES